MHLREEVRLTGHALCSSVLHILCQRNPELGVADRVVFIAAKRTLGRVLAAPGMKVFVIPEGTPGTWRERLGGLKMKKPHPQREKDISKVFQSRTLNSCLKRPSGNLDQVALVQLVQPPANGLETWNASPGFPTSFGSSIFLD